jgi:hypothetical protein
MLGPTSTRSIQPITLSAASLNNRRHNAKPPARRLCLLNGVLTVPGVAGGARHTDVGPEFALPAEFRVPRYSSLGERRGHLYPGRILREHGDGQAKTFCAAFVEFHL